MAIVNRVVNVISVLLAAEQRLVRDGLSALVNQEDDIQVVSEARSHQEVLPVAKASEAEVALICEDIGISAAENLREEVPHCAPLLIVAPPTPGTVRAALRAQLSGMVTTESSASSMKSAIRRVARGEMAFEKSLMLRALAGEGNPLTPRERQVLGALAEGIDVKKIARDFHLHVGTVQNHLTAAVRKIGAVNRREAMKKAIYQGWLKP